MRILLRILLLVLILGAYIGMVYMPKEEEIKKKVDEITRLPAVAF